MASKVETTMKTTFERDVLFSIMIPSFHSEKWVKETIDSIYRQTYKYYEILICDQADTNTKPIFNGYKGISFYYTKIASTYLARKTLIENATGDYLIFLDSDDLLHPKTLEILNGLIKANKGIDCVKFKIAPFEGQPAYDDIQADSISCEFLKCKTYIFNSNIFDVAGASNIASTCLKNKPFIIDEHNISMWEDVLLINILLNQCDTMCILDFPLYYYRIHSQSIMHSVSIKNLTDISEAIISLFLLYDYEKQIVSRYLKQYSLYTALSLSKLLSTSNIQTGIKEFYSNQNVILLLNLMKDKKYRFNSIKANICRNLLFKKRIKVLKILGMIKK